MPRTEQNRPASELNSFEHAFIQNFLPVGKKGRRTQSLYNTFFQNVPPPASMRQRGVGAIMQ